MRNWRALPCPTVIISGNHDNSGQGAVLARMEFAHAGHHVTLIDDAEGALFEFPELHASVWAAACSTTARRIGSWPDRRRGCAICGTSAWRTASTWTIRTLNV